MFYEHSSLDINQSTAKASFTISLLNTHRQPTANSTAKENKNSVKGVMELRS